MYLHPDYTLQTLSDTPYLLPFGAGIAAFRHPVKLDSTGAFLWDSLKNITVLPELTKENLALKLAELTCREYGLPASEMQNIEKDMYAFIELLQSQDILTEKNRKKSIRPLSCACSLYALCLMKKNLSLRFPSQIWK